MDTKVMTAHFPLPLSDKLDEVSNRLERSKAWIVKQALNDWIALEEERHKMTLQALDDVDTGKVIDHQSMQAWAESLNSSNF